MNPFRQKLEKLQGSKAKLDRPTSHDAAMEKSFALGTGRSGNSSSRRTSKQAATRIDRTVANAKKSIELQQRINLLTSQAEKFDKGEIDARGKSLIPKTSRTKTKPEKQPTELFVAVWATGIGYADKSREVNGDYKKIAHLFFDTLELKVYSPRSSLLPEIQEHAAKIQARKGEQYQTSSGGQFITLGYGLK